MSEDQIFSCMRFEIPEQAIGVVEKFLTTKSNNAHKTLLLDVNRNMPVCWESDLLAFQIRF